MSENDCVSCEIVSREIEPEVIHLHAHERGGKRIRTL